MESEGRLQVIKCHIPLSEMSGSLNIKQMALKSAIDGQSIALPAFTDMLTACGIIKVPDFVTEIKSKGTGGFKVPREMSPEIARFLGYLDLTAQAKPQPYQCFAQFLSQLLDLQQSMDMTS